MDLICRLCLENFVHNTDNPDPINKIQINYLLPEVDTNLTSTLNLCHRCTKSLNDACVFKRKCIKIEGIIKRYLKAYPDNMPLDLKNVKDKFYGNTFTIYTNTTDEINLVQRNNFKTEQKLIATNMKITKTDELKWNKNKDKSIENNNNFEENLLVSNDVPIFTETNYNCSKCENIFVDMNAYQSHIKECLLYQCDECQKVLFSSNELADHKQIHTSIKSFLCEICSKTFKNSASLKSHIASHNNNKSFTCTNCKKVFTSQKLLSAHSKTHTDRERRYICKICNKGFHILQRLKRHEICHKEERKFKCTICEKSYKVPSYLQRHIISSHGGIRKHICHICGIKLRTKSTLEEHVRTHTGERPFKCELCGKGFSQNSTLLVHVRSVHGEEKPFSCEACGKMFTLKGNLKAHMEIHKANIEKKFVCNHCGKQFRMNTHLRKHVTRHLGIKTHTCTICNKGFIGSTALKIHLRSHTGEKPFECEICHKSFTQNGNLRIHLKSHKTKN